MILKNILKGQVNYKNASYINIEKDINNKINKILNLIVYDVNKKKTTSCSYITDYIKYMNKHVYKLRDEQDLIPDSKDNLYIQWKYYNQITVNVLKEYVKKCHRNNIDGNYNYEKKKRTEPYILTANDTCALFPFHMIDNYAKTKEKKKKHDVYYDMCNILGNKNVSCEKNIINLQKCEEEITCEIQNDKSIDNHIISKRNNIEEHIFENYVQKDKNILNNSSYIYYNIPNLNYIKYMWLHHSLVIFKLLIDTNLKVDIKRQFNMTKIIVSLLKQLNNNNSNNNNNINSSSNNINSSSNNINSSSNNINSSSNNINSSSNNINSSSNKYYYTNIIDIDLYLSYFYLLSKINMIDKHMVIQLCTLFKKDYKKLSDLNKFYLLRSIYNFDYSSKHFQQMLNYLQKYFYTLIKKHYLDNNTYHNYDACISSIYGKKEISSNDMCYNIGRTQKGEKNEITSLRKYTKEIDVNENVNANVNVNENINNINYNNSDDAYNNTELYNTFLPSSYNMYNTDMCYNVLSKKINKNNDKLFFHNYLLEIFEVLFKRKKHISLLDKTIFKCVVNQEISIYNKINLDLFKNIVKLCDEELIYFLFNKIIQDIENYDNLEIYQLLTHLKKYEENNSLCYFYNFFLILKEKQFEYMNIKHVIYIYIYINRYLTKEFKKQQKKKMMKDLISINITEKINEIHNVDNMIDMLHKKSNFTSQYEYIYTFLNFSIYNINNINKYDNKQIIKNKTDDNHNVEIFNKLLNEHINEKDKDVKKDDFFSSENKDKMDMKMKIKNEFMCIELLNDINKNITIVLSQKINYINIKNIITLLYNTCQIRYEYQMSFVMNLFFHLYEEYSMLINFLHLYKILFQNFLFYYYNGITEYIKEIYDENKGEYIYMDKRNNYMIYTYENKMKHIYNYINRRYYINEHRLYDINKFTILLNIYEKYLFNFITYNIYKCSNIQNEKINEKIKENEILKNSFFIIYIYTHLQYIIFNKKKKYNHNIPLNNVELIFKYSKQIIKKINIYLKSNLWALGYIQNMNDFKCNDDNHKNINNFEMSKHTKYKFNNEVECNVLSNHFYEKNKFDILLFEKLEDKKFAPIINISTFINSYNNKEYNEFTNDIIPYNINNSILNFEYNVVPLFYHILQYINYICTYIYFNTNTNENINIKESLIFISLTCLKNNFNISNHNILLMNNIYTILKSIHINEINKNILFIISLDYIYKYCNVKNIIRKLFRSSKNRKFNYNFNINDIHENTRCKILSRYIKYLKSVHIS
ncbi:hypothetical protein CYL21_2150 [Plasmodium falciparum NF54]|uniref:Uncharacterized protein n=2 Tax=Plasmodium falciparum TaxID=5833 RepID=C6S3I5_PLAF7|nr:conserved Plasmodium protein, unknown function [Plasmodium falciparum 3D7]KAF4329001.1 hypothetical protein CYL21_2150 [Plasmodium falciparum NF54]PKC49649.1 hypothetical protein CK202_0370 [Plasmodium falciparum NF54]CZU00062.1 conserved Plasmodium protein, unknown function [Plasmodium falciparum 3D7]|eukprot:XP_002585461.1 conserved Plasmodium protein, unknown function [Plasmodium falciparum 3D7]